MLDTIRQIFQSDAEPTREDLTAARARAQKAREAAEAELKALKSDRPDVLIHGTAEDLDAHDEKIERAEATIERAEATAKEIGRREKAARADEEIEAAIEEPLALPARLAAVRDAERQLDDALEELQASVEVVQRGYHRAERERRLAEMPAIDERLLEEVAVALGRGGAGNGVKTLRPFEPAPITLPALPKNPARKIVVDVGGDEVRLEGDWTQDQMRRASRQVGRAVKLRKRGA